MKREITISKNGNKSSSKWGYVGEKNATHIVIELPDRLVNCDFCQAEISANGKKVPTERLEILDSKVTVVIPFESTKKCGRISVQIIGYVVDEAGGISAIGKSAVYCGQISPSVSGEITDETSEPSLLHRIWAKSEAWASKIHEHVNLNVLELLRRSGDTLSYNGRQLVDERALKIYETLNDVYEDDFAPTLCYVVTNRAEFVPIELEVGVRYGGHADLKDREGLYVDPLLVDFFPCEPFKITTELVQVEPSVDRYGNHTFATDGSTWFRFDDNCVYNNTYEPIVLDSIEYPFHGWNYFNGEEVHRINPTVDAEYFLFFSLIDVKFSSDDNFSDLQKILSNTPAYKGGIKGLYVYNGLMYQHLTKYMSNTNISLNSALELSHSHHNKALLDSLTEDSLSGGIPAVHTLPSEAADGDMCLYSPANVIEPCDSGKRIYFDWEEFAKPVSNRGQYTVRLFDKANNMFVVDLSRGTSVCGGQCGFTMEKGTIDVRFENGVLDTTYSGIYTSYGVKTPFNSVDELPRYYELPQFTEVIVDASTTTPMCYAPYQLMVYRAGEWQRVETLLDIPTGIDSYIPADKIELTTETATLEPNTHYSFGEVATLTLEFAEGDAAKVNEYMFSFTSGETATVLTLPSSVQWANELTVEANKRYEISVVDNIGLWCAVDLAVSE